MYAPCRMVYFPLLRVKVPLGKEGELVEFVEHLALAVFALLGGVDEKMKMILRTAYVPVGAGYRSEREAVEVLYCAAMKASQRLGYDMVSATESKFQNVGSEEQPVVSVKKEVEGS